VRSVQAVARVGREAREVEGGAIGTRFAALVGVGVVHAQRLEDAFPHHLQERLTSRRFHGGTDRDPAVVRLAVCGARLEQQRTIGEVGERVHRSLTRDREHRTFVAAVAADPGQMSHHVPQGDRPLLAGERRDLGVNLVVEGQPALFQQEADCR
jgi:hypothetical protein